MNEQDNIQSRIQRIAINATIRTANTLTDIIQNVTVVSIVGLAASAAGYFMFFNWLSHQDQIALLRYLPAIVSIVGFMYAIYKAVPVIEDFWGLKRTRINTSHPLCTYIAIAMWLIFINSFFFAFGFQIENGVPFHEMLYNFFGRYGNDTNHYINIARQWYQNSQDDYKFKIVFFPFYAILIRIMYFVSPSYMFAAYAVSTIFAFAAGVMLYKLAMLITNPKEARLAVKFMFIFPSAFFLFMPMTESLFLFLSVAVVYYAIKAKYIQVFIFGVMAALTRSVGVLLFIPAACEIINQMRISYKNVISQSSDAASLRFMARIRLGLSRSELLKFTSLLAFPLGIGIYLLINYMVYGNATQFMIFQYEHWGQSMYFFWNTVTYLSIGITNFNTGIVLGLFIPGVIVIFLTLGVIIYGANKIRPSLTLYAMAYFIFAFGPTWLMSGPRYAMVIFPLAFAAAKLAGTKKGYNLGLTIAYLVMFALYFNELIRNNFVF